MWFHAQLAQNIMNGIYFMLWRLLDKGVVGEVHNLEVIRATSIVSWIIRGSPVDWCWCIYMRLNTVIINMRQLVRYLIAHSFDSNFKVKYFPEFFFNFAPANQSVSQSVTQANPKWIKNNSSVKTVKMLIKKSMGLVFIITVFTWDGSE